MLTWMNINLNAIKHNIDVIRGAIEPETKIIAVVKANAYGHGLVEVARAAWLGGAELLAVRDVEEAVSLRIAKIKAPILVMGYVQPSDYQRIIENNLQISLFNKEDIRELAQVANESHTPIRVHIKVDTGLNRLGVATNELADFIAAIGKEHYLVVEAVYSHFADCDNREYSNEQIKNMQSALFSAQQSGIGELPPVHMARSEAIIKYPGSIFDMVRPGLAIYGLCDAFEGLIPALSWKTKIVQIKKMPEGSYVGYDLTHKTNRITTVGVLPVGYADGYPRSLSNKSYVLFDGKRVKVIGKISMCMTMVDITGTNARLGDNVTLIGPDMGDMIDAREVADWAGTSVYEIVSRISPEIYRHYYENKSEMI